MAVTATGAFAQTPRTVYALLTTACSNYAASTNKVRFLTDAGANYTATANGILIVKATVLPTATVTTAAQMIVWVILSGDTVAIPLISGVQATYTLAQTTALPITALTDTNGNGISDQNPIYVSPSAVLYGSTGQTQTSTMCLQILEL